ncbi:hypothetical protein ABW21_db0200649 [Orbilia brochopaga]|nr:hypothetical protein ABW21_db0200649 [Drechslerella brochopaga]
MSTSEKKANPFINESIVHQPPEGFAVRDATMDDIGDIIRLWYMTFYTSSDFWKIVTPETPAARKWLNELWALGIQNSPERNRTFVVEDLANDKKIVAFSRWQVPIADGTQYDGSYPKHYPAEWDPEFLDGVWGAIARKRKEIMGDKVHLLGEFIGTDPAYRRQHLAYMLMDWGCRHEDALNMEGYHIATPTGRPFHQSVGYKDVGVLQMPYRPDTYGTYECTPQLRLPGAARIVPLRKATQETVQNTRMSHRPTSDQYAAPTGA